MVARLPAKPDSIDRPEFATTWVGDQLLSKQCTPACCHAAAQAIFEVFNLPLLVNLDAQ